LAEEQCEVIWTTSARNDFDDIVAYIAKDGPVSAPAFLKEVLACADMLVILARRGRIGPELQNPRIRELFINRYRLLYEIDHRAVNVLGLIHGAREIKPDEIN